MRFFEASDPLASPFVGAGVELDSEALSLTSGTLSVELSSGTGAGDEADEGVDCSSSLVGTGSGSGSGSKRLSNFGDIFSTTIFACFLFLSERATAVEGDRVEVAEDTAMAGRNGVVDR